MNYTILKKEEYSLLSFKESKIMAEKAMQMKGDFIKQFQEKNISSYWVIDLKEVKFLDSAGLGAFLTLYRLIRDTGRQLYFIGIQGHVEKLLAIAKLNNIFQIYESLEEVEKIIAEQK